MIFLDWLRHAWFAWSTVLVLLALSAVLLLAGVSQAASGGAWSPVVLLCAVGLAGLAGAGWWRFLAPPRRLRATTAQLRVPIWRPALVLALALLVPVTLLAVVGLVTALLVGSPWWPWVALVVLTSPLTPQILRSLLRRPVLAIGPDTLTYRGPTVDADVSWDDVVAIEAGRNRRGLVLAVRVRPGAPSWRWRRSFWVTPVEFRLAEPGLEVEVQGPRDLELVEVLLPVLQAYLGSPRSRSEIGTPAVAERLAAARSAR